MSQTPDKFTSEDLAEIEKILKDKSTLTKTMLITRHGLIPFNPREIKSGCKYYSGEILMPCAVSDNCNECKHYQKR